METENQSDNFEVVEVSSKALEAIERSTVDIQVSTAKRYPRPKNNKIIQQMIMADALVNEETARECYYAVPRAGGVINGASARLSEIISNRFGNIHTACRIIEHDLVRRTVTAQAYAWDLETNNRKTAEWSEPITIKSSDAVKITKLSALSKAERNAVLKVVPRVIWQPVLDACINAAIGDAASLGTRLQKAVKAFSAYGIVPEQILAVFQVDSLDKLTGNDLGTLLGMHTAIKEGTATIDELFKPIAKKEAVVEKQGDEHRAETSPASPDPVHFEPTARRRGRPVGSTNKPKENQAQQVVDAAREINETATAADTAESEKQPVVQMVGQSDEQPTVPATTPSPKSEAIELIRGELKRGDIAESRLLAQLREWKFGSSDSTALDQLSQNDLEMIYKRWDQISQYLKK
jgi:hypothetical protein